MTKYPSNAIKDSSSEEREVIEKVEDSLSPLALRLNEGRGKLLGSNEEIKKFQHEK